MTVYRPASASWYGLYGNRTVRVKVIDRGPFAGDREFDLTGATKNRLNFGGTGTVLSSK